MRKKLIFIALFSLLSVWLQAQNRNFETVYLEGQVLSADSLQPIPLVNITAPRRGAGTATDEEGYFNIRVRRIDTLVFRSVGYVSKMISFADSTGSDFYLKIKLQPRTYTLKPVDIYAYDLEEIFNKARGEEFSLERKDNKGEPLFERTEAEKKPTIGLGTNPGMQGGAALTGAVTAFANLFNKEFKQRKKLQEILAAEREQKMWEMHRNSLINNYKAIASNVTGLQGEELEKFSKEYIPPFHFLMESSEYEVIVRIHDDFREYQLKYKLEEMSLNDLLENAKFKRE
ncbi:MAG: carboxypeptidase-like regulatory domain-containing protein [Cyclobacteriaceae bacterium]